ncbi:hypothetical protein LTR92_000461 [Exophiala xenobiotica]|nr:hypothetical protein LTR92_000461 [Exophiala xenobiotica]KAK5332001.1 hypothetical protein LTR93_001006 [Exophiala xenobiotica]KAK5422203.1 hypothetical protein LTR06_000460 [Exophiala xenobiotica]
MFPSPPTPSSPSHVQQAASQGAGLTPLSSNTNLQSPSSPTTGLVSFQKAEEQSWFYYLSEIALRRIQNRVLHAFYRDGPHTWSRNNIFDMARSAASFEVQLEAWQRSLPEPIQFKDLAVPELDELRSVTRGRYLGILGVVYRPFLYFAIHHPHDQSFETEQLIRPLIRKGLANLVEATLNLSVEHRHHGTWLKCRGVATFALVLLATKRGGLFPDDANANYQHIDPDFSVDRSVQKCVDGLKLWERESPDIAKAVEVIQSLRQESATS